MKTLTLFLAVSLALSFERSLGAVTVKNTAGQEMNVEVLAFTKSSGNVRIKRLPDGAIFNVKLKLFDAESQAKIKEAAPKPKPKLEIKVSAGARRDNVKNSGFMERQKITATIEVTNDSRDVDLAETKFTMLIVGRNTSRFANKEEDGCVILSSQSVTQAIPAGKVMKFECKPIVTEYDEDKDSSNLGGWDYDGYLLIMQDKAGEVFDAKCTIGPAQTLILKDPVALKNAAAYKEGKKVPRTLMPYSGR